MAAMPRPGTRCCRCPVGSALAQDVLVELGHAIWVDGPRQEVGELLVSPRFGAVPRRAIFVERHEVAGAFLAVLVEVGRVRVVPVLLELLPEDALRRQLLLRTKQAHPSISIRFNSVSLIWWIVFELFDVKYSSRCYYESMLAVSECISKINIYI